MTKAMAWKKIILKPIPYTKMHLMHFRRWQKMVLPKHKTISDYVMITDEVQRKTKSLLSQLTRKQQSKDMHVRNVTLEVAIIKAMVLRNHMRKL